MSVYVFATLHCIPAYFEAVREGLAGMALSSNAEPGCLQYRLFEAADKLATLHVFEEYADLAALDAHRAAPHYKAYREFVTDKLALPAQVNVMAAL